LQYFAVMKDKNRLRIVRAEKRVTQIVLANRAKINPPRISHIENGHITPSSTEKSAIARALRVPVHEVFPPEAVQS
jgi:DNA-binding XRE family transcriptional regulator